jgi:hypothetical protein
MKKVENRLLHEISRRFTLSLLPRPAKLMA